MSRALAGAKQRRSGIVATDPAQSRSSQDSMQQQQQPQSGLTLPQVIALVDTRLVKLEKFMGDSQRNPVKQDSVSSTVDTSDIYNSLYDEFDARFKIFAQEIGELKDIVLKLQSYTMDVNKILMEERVQILSDIEVNSDAASNSLFTMNNITMENNDTTYEVTGLYNGNDNNNDISNIE